MTIRHLLILIAFSALVCFAIRFEDMKRVRNINAGTAAYREGLSASSNPYRAIRGQADEYWAWKRGWEMEVNR